MAKLKNAKVYYGLHFVPGVAEYHDSPSENPYRILIEEDVMRLMDPSMNGNPLFVEHVDSVNFADKDLDGRVSESFFNQADGAHWAKFMVDTEEADQAIAQGWTLSNAYIPQFDETPGVWHNVQYDKKVISGKFEHLALVPNPRYQESKILTPEQFKAYNEDKLAELAALKNSAPEKKETPMAFKLFGKTEVKNADEIAKYSVTLPKSNKTVTVEQLINDADEHEMHKGEHNDDMADLGHRVKLHDESYCNVGELLERHRQMNEEHEMLKKQYAELNEAFETAKQQPGSDEATAEVNDDDSDEDTKKKAEEIAAHEKKEMESKKNRKLNADEIKEINTKAAAKAKALVSNSREHQANLEKAKALLNAGPSKEKGGEYEGLIMTNEMAAQKAKNSFSN